MGKRTLSTSLAACLSHMVSESYLDVDVDVAVGAPVAILLIELAMHIFRYAMRRSISWQYDQSNDFKWKRTFNENTTYLSLS
jgi:hypothetical protein